MRTTAAFLSIISLALGHGEIASPPARQPGTAQQAACGMQVYYNQASDRKGNVQGILQVARSQSDFKPDECNVWLCKGYQFADNAANVQAYTAGQEIPFRIDIGAPHTGVMNVSVVNAQTNSVIGSPLISMEDYASTAHTIPDNNRAFTVTMPDVGSQCTTPGNCVLQWFWDARDIDQTYEGCVDFTVGGGSGGAAPPAATSPAATSPTATSAAAAAGSSAPATTAAPATPSTPATPADDDDEYECVDDDETPAAPAVTTTRPLAPSATAAAVASSPAAPIATADAETCENNSPAVKERRHPRQFVAPLH